MILGKIIGTQLLGFYSKGYTVTQAGTSDIGTTVIHASFPVYVRISGDTERIKRAFYKVFIFSACFLLIPTFIFILFPQLIVNILLGSKWQPVVYILPLLAVAGYIQALFNIGSTLLTAKKKYGYLVALLTVTFITMIATIVPLSLQLGLYGAALSIVISRVVALPFFMVFIMWTLHPKK